ncbi:protein phosphatase 2C domain-containing protein [Bradyrhizobium sp. CCBAU 51765]|uniref:protein phosphatase 2C domain-containing protein n=1 Tax=Bradyrhizobium sp. CCBAU 51765 TaxID=1325102 RepID=UPI0018898919|nr:protein phosphatase 2C domain-containing protein [Bradyrhizobium sp. CCBAU 51765]
MELLLNWRSQQGTKTDDNRDYGGAGVRADGVLCLVLDGSTSGPNSGELARQFVCEVVDWYVTTDEVISAQALTTQLRKVHATLSKRFSQDAASYVIVSLPENGPILVLHAGDCLLGHQAGERPPQWLVRPHTLANAFDDMPIAEIARSHARHRLTRSFRAREFMLPDVAEVQARQGSSVVAATDGFWAELNYEQQAMFMGGQGLPTTGGADDRSALTIRMLVDEPGIKVSFNELPSNNFYLNGASL